MAMKAAGSAFQLAPFNGPGGRVRDSYHIASRDLGISITV